MPLNFLFHTNRVKPDVGYLFYLHNIPMRIMINELNFIPKQVVPGFVGLVTDKSE